MSIIRRLILWLIIVSFSCFIIFICLYAYYNNTMNFMSFGAFLRHSMPFLRKSDNDLYFHSETVHQGNDKAERGEYAAAITDFDTAILSNPDDAVAHFYRGQAKFHLKRHFAAISDFDTAIRLNPGYSQAYYYRGMSKRNLNQIKAAMVDYSAAIRLNPKYVNAYYERGRAYMNRNGYSYDIEEAISDFSTVIKLDPENVRAYIYRGLSREENWRYTALNSLVITDYDTAVRLAPDYAPAYYFRALYRARFSSDGLESKEDIQTALKLADQAGDVKLKESMEKGYMERNMTDSEKF